MNQLKYCIVCCVIALALLSCDDSYQSSIPDYYVNLSLDLNTSYSSIRNNPNHYLLFEKPNFATDGVGYGGILVYCGWDSYYYAFDLSCPYERKPSTRVHPNDLGQAICDSCKTVFDISLGIGNPISRKRLNASDTTALAKEPLRRYKASLSGNILYISK